MPVSLRRSLSEDPSRGVQAISPCAEHLQSLQGWPQGGGGPVLRCVVVVQAGCPSLPGHRNAD